VVFAEEALLGLGHVLEDAVVTEVELWSPNAVSGDVMVIRKTR
jgi:hypothetical protein